MLSPRSSPLLPSIVLAVAAAACSSTPGEDLDAGTVPDTGPTPPRDAGTPPPADAGFPDAGEVPGPCSPALEVQRATAAVLPLDLFTVVASGGTGQYRFELESNESGAIINALSGAYLSGDVEGSTDVVLVKDEGCTDEVRVQIRVVQRLRLQPDAVEAEPGTSWTFETVGGSGTFRFSMVLAGSGGTVTERGAYQAGASDGEDVVEVLDVETGQTAEARITVLAGTQLAASPPMVLVPVGHEFELGFRGGSGFVEVTTSVSAFELRGGRVVAGLAAGREVVTLRDRFTGQTAPLVVAVSEAQSFTATRFGDGLFNSRILTPGDLNGDGMPDGILANPEADIGAVRDGAVYVYAGTPVALDPTPAQVLTGKDRRDEFGRAIASGDFNRDGLVDIVVGAPRADAAGTDVGTVSIYHGVANGFFDPVPAQVLAGRFGGDLFGWAVTVCDFNDDGFLDIAVGAYNSEDRDRTPVRFNQGGVQIFNGHDSGFPPEPTRSLWGDVPDGNGGWNGLSNMHHGIALAAGDIDGDGICDLAAGTFEYDEPGDTNTGLVYVYAGSAGDGTTPGGLGPRPVLGWTSQEAQDIGGNLGRNLAVGDLDGDQRAEVVISHHNYDFGSGDSHGAVRVFRGAPFGTELTALAPVSPADFEVVHEGSGDQIGFMPVIADATGDGQDDLLIGNIADEATGTPGNSGTIRVYAARAGQLPDPAEPTRVLSGVAAADYLGSAFGVLGDIDGDMTPEVFALAHYADRLGPEVGEPLVMFGNPMVAPFSLDMPSSPAGMQFGRTAAIVGDVDGDGFEDLVVGAPESAVEGMGRLAGEAYLYRGSARGFSNTPDVVLSGMRRHSSFDRLGMGVSTAGDFDGDGATDFAVVSRFEDQSSNPGANYALEANCSGAISNIGAVYVFRGSRDGSIDTVPAYIIYGLTSGDGTREVQGGFDYDGDGLDDLVISSLDLDRPGVGNMGGLGLVRGRAPDAMGRTVVVCGPDFRFEGLRANDQLGYQIAVVGDVNGDGCDEVAAGAPFADPTTTNEGTVHVLFGFGGAGCPANPEMVVMRSGVRNATAGRAVAGGGDVDGDGVPDLAVGLSGFAQNGNTVGAAAVVYGAYIASLPREPAQFLNPPQNYRLLFDVSRPPSFVVGTTPGEEMGRGVALLDLGAPTGTVLVVGSPSSDLSGVTRSGAAQAFLWTDPGGFVPLPLFGFGGETVRPGGRLGELVRAGRLNGRPMVLLGGYDGTSVGLDGGSLYAFDVALP